MKEEWERCLPRNYQIEKIKLARQGSAMIITITTPFADKEYCFDLYCKSIEGILKYPYAEKIDLKINRKV